MCRTAKKEYFGQWCVEIEDLGKGDVQMMHEKVQAVPSKKKHIVYSCISDDGDSASIELDQIEKGGGQSTYEVYIQI